MPFLAILRFDLRTLVGSWLVRLWFGASALLTLLIMAVCWQTVPSTHLIAGLLVPYLFFPWFLVVVVLGVDPVSAARTEALADGILSRPITRFEYLTASWAARVLVVLGNYCAVIVPAVVWVALAERRAADTVTVYGLLAALGVVGLVLTFLVSLAYLLGTLLRRPLLAIVLVLFIWYPSNAILDNFKLDAFSTLNLTRRLPILLRTPWRTESTLADAEKQIGLQDFVSGTNQFLAAFGGPGQTSVAQDKGFFQKSAHEDFSLLRVLLGYGLSTVVCVVFTLLSFCYRDL